MFARAERKRGTAPYEDYYAGRPRRQRLDDRIRAMPQLLSPDGLLYEESAARETHRWFAKIDEIEPDPDMIREWAGKIRLADDPKRVVRDLARSLGAVASGATPLEPRFVYSHKGRFDEDYGHEVTLDHPSAIVFLVEMDHDTMQHAPRAPVIRESARQYYRAARVSLVLAAAIEAAGYSAKAHYDAHYDVILPPLAVAAGLGEMGRHNILIANRFGTRVRIGAVTTDLPVECDRERSLGADRFCRLCLKCADNCPSRSLTRGEKVEVRGVRKWPTQVERCFAYWRRVGSDCGICMATCPFSHENSRFHNLVRWIVRRMPFMNRLMLWFDDRIYGREWDRTGRGSGELT